MIRHINECSRYSKVDQIFKQRCYGNGERVHRTSEQSILSFYDAVLAVVLVDRDTNPAHVGGYSVSIRIK